MTGHATHTSVARKHQLVYVERPGREWAECACGWASPDIWGRAEMRRQWWKHMREMKR